MSGILIEIIKVGSVAYISQKALKSFGKKDYADIITFVGWCAIGANVMQLFIGIGEAISNSEIAKLINGINNAAGTVRGWLTW